MKIHMMHFDKVREWSGVFLSLYWFSFIAKLQNLWAAKENENNLKD